MEARADFKAALRQDLHELAWKRQQVATDQTIIEPEDDYGFSYPLPMVRQYANLTDGAPALSVTQFIEDESNYPGFHAEVQLYLWLQRIETKLVAKTAKEAARDA